MSVNRLVSIKIPVLNAFQDMGIDHTKDLPTFTRWAADAEREIGSFYSYKKKNQVLTIKGCTASLPCDSAFVQGVVLGDCGCDCGELFTNIFTTATTIGADIDNTFLLVDKSDPNFNSASPFAVSDIRWKVQQGSLIFNKNYDGQKITIQYLGFSTDCDGFPEVMENHVEALVTYIQYKYAVRSRFSPVKMDHTDKMFFWKEWMRLASHARADDAELSETDRIEIVSMIHDPFCGYGMSGLINREDNLTGMYQGWR